MNKIEKFMQTTKARIDARIALSREQERLWSGK
jgi:hypothetical protein